MASRECPGFLTFPARGRQIFEKFENSEGPQCRNYNFLSVWTLRGGEGRRPLPEAVSISSKIVR
jgi:hypothetical protein